MLDVCAWYVQNEDNHDFDKHINIYYLQFQSVYTKIQHVCYRYQELWINIQQFYWPWYDEVYIYISYLLLTLWMALVVDNGHQHEYESNISGKLKWPLKHHWLHSTRTPLLCVFYKCKQYFSKSPFVSILWLYGNLKRELLLLSDNWIKSKKYPMPIKEMVVLLEQYEKCMERCSPPPHPSYLSVN